MVVTGYTQVYWSNNMNYMDDVTWTIVQFIEDLTVEAIPTSWIQGEYCHWPPYKQEKLTNAIKKCEALNTNWPRHAIKIFRNATFDEYVKARLKARLAEDGSDLNSGNESTGKRKRIQKIISSSSSSDNSIDDSFKLPPPPKISRSLNSSQFMDSNISLDSNQIGSKKSFNINFDDLHIPSTSATAISKPVFSAVSVAATSDENTVQDVTESQAGPSCCLQHDNTILIEIKNQNHMIRGILIDVLNEIRLLKNSKSESSTTNSMFTKYADIQFPIGSDEHISRFEEELKNEDNFMEAVNELAKFGGSSPYNFIKRTMHALIKDTVLIKYSWLGRKGKRRLESSAIAKLLIRAADKCLTSSQKSVEEAIQSFIKRSRERLAAKENKRT